MAYGLSFSAAFYGDCEKATKSDRPTNVADALASMPDDTWSGMCSEVFNRSPDYVDLEAVMLKIRDTDTCSNLDSPVSVWIDEEGWYAVDVYYTHELKRKD